MGVCGYSLEGEPTAGDFEGEVAADFVDFLKNLDADLFGGGGCGEEDGEPLKVAGEGKRGRVVEVEDDCVERASVSGEIRCEEEMNKDRRRVCFGLRRYL